MDIMLYGMTLSVRLNGKKIHDNVRIKGPTGGQSGDDNVTMGPLMLEGNHGAVCFATAVFESCERLHKIIIITDKCTGGLPNPWGEIISPLLPAFNICAGQPHTFA